MVYSKAVTLSNIFLQRPQSVFKPSLSASLAVIVGCDSTCRINLNAAVWATTALAYKKPPVFDTTLASSLAYAVLDNSTRDGLDKNNLESSWLPHQARRPTDKKDVEEEEARLPQVRPRKGGPSGHSEMEQQLQ